MNIKLEWIGDFIKGVGEWVVETFTVWRLLTVSCIVFAAGISGTWFNDQFSDNLQVSRWGWFGATIAGVAIFSGVMLAVDSLEPISTKREKEDTDESYQGKIERARLIKDIGFWAGVGAVIVGVLADCVMSAAYFGAGHDFFTAAVLGFYPSVLSVIGGVIEGVRGIGKRNEKRQAKEHDADRDITLKIELAKIDARKEIALNKQLLLIDEQRANVHERPEPFKVVRELSKDEHEFLSLVRESFGQSFTSSQAEEISPLGRTKTYEALGVAIERKLITKEGKGKYQFNG